MEIIKSPTDERQYRIVHLPNGLTAALVHDPAVLTHEDEEVSPVGDGRESIRLAAGSMYVGVGSLSDPEDAPGIAHYLEHIITKGTSRFPAFHEYHSCFHNSGGLSNAFTRELDTRYMFSASGVFLKKCLEMFSQIFISPLLKDEALREIEAVNEEFHLDSTDDECRLQEVMYHSSVKGHPYEIMAGKRENLKLTEAGHPLKRITGVDLRKILFEFFDKHYVASNMKLVVIGGEPLDTLEEWVLEFFSGIRKGDYDRISFERNGIGTVWEPGRIFWVDSLRDVQRLSLTWPLPSLVKEYLKRPEIYLSYVICQGGLLSLLKSKGFVTHLFYDGGESANYLFHVKILLTKLGLENVLEVIGIFHQYLKLLREMGPQIGVFEDLQAIKKVEFMYPAEEAQFEYANRLSENLFTYPEEHLLYGDYAIEEWDPDLISHTLSLLNPRNMRIDILRKTFGCESSDVEYEAWYGTPYRVENISPEVLDDWENPSYVDPDLYPPGQNDYIPPNLSITNYNFKEKQEIPECTTEEEIYDYEESSEISEYDFEESSEIPKCIIKEEMINVWYKHLDVTRSKIRFLIMTEEFDCILAEVYVELLRDALTDIMSQAEACALITHVEIGGDSSIKLQIQGYNERLPILVTDVLRAIKLFEPEEDRLEIIKELLVREYQYLNMNPLSTKQVLSGGRPELNSNVKCILSVSLSDMKNFVSQLFEKVHIVGLCCGKISETEIFYIADVFKETFGDSKALKVNQSGFWPSLELDKGADETKDALVESKSEVVSKVEIYFQIGRKKAKNFALVDFFDYFFFDPFFAELRGKDQLGYSLSTSKRFTANAVGFYFTIESCRHSPPYLEKKIWEFIDKRLPEVLVNMNDKKFQACKNVILTKHLEKCSYLQYLFDLWWAEIINKTYGFQRHRLEAAQIKYFSKSDIIYSYDKLLHSASLKSTTLTVRVWGSSTKPFLQHERGINKFEEFQGEGKENQCELNIQFDEGHDNERVLRVWGSNRMSFQENECGLLQVEEFHGYEPEDESMDEL